MADPRPLRAPSSAHRVFAGLGAALAIGLCGLPPAASEAQQPAKVSPDEQKKAPEPDRATSFRPEVEVQSEDYAEVRKRFRTRLVREGPSPQKGTMPRT